MKKRLFTLTVIVAALVTWQRATLLGRYYFYRLTSATSEQRLPWLERLAELDVDVQPLAMDRLRSLEESVCQSSESVLSRLAQRWTMGDDRPRNLVGDLLDSFPSFSEPGKRCAARVAAVVLDRADEEAVPQSLLRPAAELLRLAAEDLQATSPVLLLAGTLAKRGVCDADSLRRLASAGLQSSEADDRAQAVRLFLGPPLNHDKPLQKELVSLLRDRSSEVRRAVLLAIGRDSDLAADDDLLPLLHDEDPEVVGLCETALRSRGLHDDHLALARLISDERPAARLQVLQQLGQIRDLDHSAWLRRMSQDTSPAVRAAALRAAAQRPQLGLRDQLKSMAQTDPSPTVRQLAEHYLQGGTHR